jgi:hypothetical protein
VIVAVARVDEISSLMGRNCRIVGGSVTTPGILKEIGKVVVKGTKLASKAVSKVIGVVSILLDVASSVFGYLKERERTSRFRIILESEIEVLNVLRIEYENLKEIKEKIKMAIEEKKKLLIEEFQKKVENKIRSVKALAIEDFSRLLSVLKNSIMEIRKEMKEILRTDGKNLGYARLEMKYYRLVREFVALSNLIAHCREARIENRNSVKELAGIGG